MKYFITVLLLFLVVLTAFSQTTVSIAKQDEEVYPFDLNDSNLYFDWTKSKNTFRDIAIFGMGEATHGTHEFFEIKAKTFEYLVTHYNYKVFGIESSYGYCCYINDYLMTGIGDLDSVMQFFWAFHEVKALLVWIRAYNENKALADQLRFYGFDMQEIGSPVRYFYEFIKQDPLLNSKVVASIAWPVLSKTNVQQYERLSNKESKYIDTLKVVERELNNWMKENEGYLKSKYTAYDIEKLNMCLETFGQAVTNGYEVNFKSNPAYRDSCMAANVIRIQRHENAKMFIWAHNGHVAKSKPNYGSGHEVFPMGYYLKKALGDKYYVIGFVFNQGSFLAADRVPENEKVGFLKRLFHGTEYTWVTKECTIPVHDKNTLTNALAATKLNGFFVDLNASDNSLFSTPQYTYIVGSTIDMGYEQCSFNTIAKDRFDGLIFIDKTSSAVRLQKR